MRFREMTQAQKRVAVAKDVIKTLDDGKIVPERGCFVDYVTCEKIESMPENSIGKAVKGIRNCRSCAIGGLFVSLVQRSNGVSKDVFFRHGDIVEDSMFSKLETIFSDKQIRMIEHAYEQGGGWFSFGGGGDKYDSKVAARFGDRYEVDEDRMRAIMKNIIKHRGTFKPDVLT